MTFLGEPISGLIGAGTGISALLLSIIAYRRSNELKKSELRLRLQTSTSKAKSDGAQLLDILEKAFPSRMAILSRFGRSNSDISRMFKAQHQEDSDRAKELTQHLSCEVENADYDAMSLPELEEGIVRIDRIACEFDHLIYRYKESIQEDDKFRQRH